MSERTFIERCLDGDAFLDEVDAAVANWHRDSTELPVWRYLGMTEAEYGLWVEQPSALRVIVAAHDREIEVEDLLTSIHSAPELVAARADYPDDAERLLDWLRRTGRLT